MQTKIIRKRLLASLAIVLVLAGGGYAGYHGYVALRQVRLNKQARQYLAKSDGKKALLCLQRALRANPKDPEACRLMAQLTEAARSPSTILWRSRVVELVPTSVEDRLALARTAVAMRDVISATNALAGVTEAGRKTAGFHNVAGAVASTLNHLAEAEAHFSEASRLEPTNPAPRLNLAVVQLQSTNLQSLAAARASLKQLSALPEVRCAAMRQLVIDAVRYRQTNDAIALSSDLVRQTNSAFSDRLLRLEVLQAAQNPQFKPALADFQHDAESDPAKICELAAWQLDKTGPAETLSWLNRLPLTILTNQPVALIAAECHARLKDWDGLQTFLAPQNWAELEFIRHAFQARAMRGRELASSAKTEWEKAVKGANDRKESLIMLLGLAGQWNWKTEGEELLQNLVNRHPGEKWAVQALTQTLFLSGQTRSLMAFYGQQSKGSPSDLALKNNLAMTALLLDAREQKPHELALEVYQKASTNAAFASTYAYSLHLQEKNAEALKIFERLKPADLENPGIAGYYGLILKATGNGAMAMTYLEKAFKGPMLPEERKLFEKAKAGA